jgi:hypothetical protein
MISQADGDALKKLLRAGAPVGVALNWTDSLPRSAKVEWEFWTNSNDECGALCDRQLDFVRRFGPTARLLQVKVRVAFLVCPTPPLWESHF